MILLNKFGKFVVPDKYKIYDQEEVYLVTLTIEK